MSALDNVLLALRRLVPSPDFGLLTRRDCTGRVAIKPQVSESDRTS